MRETKFAELMRYVRWSDSDAARLRAFHRAASSEFPRIADEFYERVREHADAHAVFTGEAQIDRLRRSLVRWMERVCVGIRDDTYFAETAQIGLAHVRVGLPQRYVLTAMALIRSALARIADREMGAESAEVRDAIARALDLELAVMLETFHDDVVARVRRVERLEKEHLGRALARSERWYVNAVEHAPYLVVGVSSGGSILLFNRSAEQTTGFARDEALNRQFVEVAIADGEAREGLAKRVEDVVRGRSTTGETFDAALVTKSGSARVVRWELAYAPTADADDAVAFAIGRDVTEESALLARTRQAEKLAAVGTLAAGLAHEIRNPLNGAQLHVTFLARGLSKVGADAETMEAVRVVGDEITRLSALVSEFLDFARPRPLERKPTALRALCEHAAALLGADARRAGASIDLDMPLAELCLEVDAPKIEQVLLNLLQNAIEAMEPKGGGRIVLRARRLPLFAVLEVEDEGPGIQAADAPIFDAFYSTKPAGTGLGLPIVHRIVTDHGGSITVDGKPGRTLFRVMLPFEETR